MVAVRPVTAQTGQDEEGAQSVGDGEQGTAFGVAGRFEGPRIDLALEAAEGVGDHFLEHVFG